MTEQFSSMYHKEKHAVIAKNGIGISIAAGIDMQSCYHSCNAAASGEVRTLVWELHGAR